MSRLRLPFVSLSVVAAITLAGCGGGSDDDQSGSGGGNGDKTATTTAKRDGGSSGGGGEASSECGGHEVDGVSVMTHCGPASAEVVVGGQTIAFEGGSCQSGEKFFSINVGTQVLEIDSSGFDQHYFGITAGDTSEASGIDEGADVVPVAGDGEYTGNDILVTWVEGEEISSLMGDDTTLTLSGNRTKGSFSGSVYGETGQATGTFDCG